jgi:hypothetical protein
MKYKADPQDTPLDYEDAEDLLSDREREEEDDDNLETGENND